MICGGGVCFSVCRAAAADDLEICDGGSFPWRRRLTDSGGGS
jgi:hypothetical protein